MAEKIAYFEEKVWQITIFEIVMRQSPKTANSMTQKR